LPMAALPVARRFLHARGAFASEPVLRGADSSRVAGKTSRSGAQLIGGLLPEVVNLSVTKYEKAAAAAGNMTSQPSMKKDQTQASGFIIDPSGLIVTNRHAVADAADIIIMLDDGTKLAGRVLAAAATERHCVGQSGCRPAAAVCAVRR
jgi:S1-C subfamily serine protease